MSFITRILEDIEGTIKHEVYYASRDYGDRQIFNVDFNPFDEGEALEIDVDKTFGEIAAAAVEDPIGTVGTFILAVTPGTQPWAYALVSGASSASQGNPPEKIVGDMALSYLGATAGDVATNQTTQYMEQVGLDQIVSSGSEKFFGATLSEVVGSSAGAFTRTLVHTEGDLESASNAFLTNSFNQGMAEVLGNIDASLRSNPELQGKGWDSLSSGVQKAVVSGINTAVQGGDVTTNTLNGLVRGYSESIIPVVNKYIGVDLMDGSQLSEESVTLMTEALGRSLNAALEGGDTTDAFFSRLKDNADEQFTKYINSREGLDINNKLDQLFGNSQEAISALSALQEEQNRYENAANSYNALRAPLTDLVATLDAKIAASQADNTNEAKFREYEAAYADVTNYVNTHGAELQRLETEFYDAQSKLPALQDAYTKAQNFLLADITEFEDVYTPVTELANEIASVSLATSTALTNETDPVFDKAAYAEAYGLSSEGEVYEHYLRNQGLAIESDLKRALGIMHNGLLQQTLSANGIDFRYLNDEQYKAALEYLAEKAPSFTSIDGPDDIIRLSDNILREIKTRSSAVDPELNQAYIDPNNYVFAEGVTISDVMAGKAVSNIVSIDGTNKIRWELQEDREKWDAAVQTSINKAAAEQGVQPYAVLDAGRRPLDETVAEVLRLTKLGYDVEVINAAAVNKQELLNSIKERVSEVEGTSDAGGYDRLLGNQEDNFGVTLTDMTVAEVLAFQKARGPGSYAEYSQGVNEGRGLLRDDGTGVISTPAGKYQIVGSTLQGLVDAGVVSLNDKFDEGTQERLGTYLIEQRGLYDANLTTAQFIENLGKEFEGIALNGLGPELTVAALDRTKIINAEAGLPSVETETLPYTMNDVQRLVADLNVVVPVILNMDEQTGKGFDERTGSVAYQNLTKLANIFGLDATTAGEERFEKSTEVIGNAASVISGSYGEMANLVGIALDYGGAEGASEFMKEASKDLLTFSNSAKSDEWQAQNIEDSERYDNLVAEWEEANPGKELTTAQKGLLKAEAIFTNIQDAPVQWVAENIGGEILQEGVNIAVGLAAKKGTSVALTGVKKSDLIDVGDRLTDIIENTAGVSGSVAVDIGEAYFGTVEGAYDKAYAEAIKMKFGEEAAEAYASELAIKNATVAAVLATISAGTGGAALAKSIFNPNKSEITNRAIDGLVVTLKESATEGLEEGITAAHLGSSLAQINPDYDAAVDVVEAGLLGTLIGGGTAGGIYTGDYMVDALIRTNKDVQNALNSEDPIVARDTLVNLGLTDVDSLNTMLNTSYDQFIVTTDEIGQIIAEVNPDFVADADTIASYAGIRDEAETRAEIEQYVGDNYVTEEEVDAAAATAGVALTDEEKASYVGQSADETTLTTFAEDVEAARNEIESFFAENNYNPTEAQVNSFLDSLTLTDARKEAISSYIDPRQVTEAEARQFFNDLGYTPTDEEVAQFTGQLDQAAQETAIGTYIDDNSVTEDEVRQAYANLGLQRPVDEDISRFVGQYAENALADQIAEYLPTAQANVISGVSNVIADLEAKIGDIANGDAPATGIYGYIDSAIQDLKDAGLDTDAVESVISEVVGVPATEETEATGIYAALGDAVNNLDTVIGQPATDSSEATGIYSAIDNAIADITSDVSGLSTIIGAPATDDAEATGIFADIADLISSGSTRDEAIQTIADNLGTTKTDLETAIANIDVTKQITDVIGEELGTPATDDAEATGVFADIADLMASGSTRDEAIQTIADNLGTTKTDLEKAIGDVELSLGEDITGIANVLGTPEVLDDPNTLDVDESQDATGLFATIKQYENAGITRDEALSLAIGDVSTALGTTETSLLNTIGTTKDDLLAIIGAPATDSTAATGIFANIDQGLGELSTSIDADISALSTSIGADIDAIANLIGKPAREVTQTDVDFVAELIASQEATAEQILQYDVTGDGFLSQLDIDLLNQTLAGDTTTGLADTSMFQDATGIYGVLQDQNIALQTQLDTLTDQNTQLNTQLNTITNAQINAERRRENEKALQAAMPRIIRESRPEKLELDYLYDFSSIFANPSQEGLFISPYGSTNTLPLKQASGFSRGGVVDMLTTTDRILDLLK